MKCREIAEIVKSVTELIESCGGRFAGSEALAQVLSAKPEKTVAALTKDIAQAAVPALHSSSSNIAEVVDFLEALLKTLSGFSKPAVTADLKALMNALRSHQGRDLDQLLVLLRTPTKVPKPAASQTAQEEIVRKYLAALEQALGDDQGFAAVMGAMQKDPLVKNPEVIALAKRFAFASVKSRAAGIKKIAARHQALMISRAKSAATAGRIAG